MGGRLDPDPVLVKEGFCWPAFFFGVVWALASGLWLVALLLAAGLIALGLVLSLVGADAATGVAAWAALALVVGFGGNDWRRARLARQGLRFSGVIAAPGRDAALRRWFDLNPIASGPVPEGAGAAWTGL